MVCVDSENADNCTIHFCIDTIYDYMHVILMILGKGLKNLRRLRSLRLDHNQLEVVTSNELTSCGCHLTHVDFSHNSLTAIQGMASLGNLEELKLASNQLTQLPDLSHCKKV